MRIGWVLIAVAVAVAVGLATDRWILGLSAGGPQQRLAAAMAGLFAGGLAATLFGVTLLLRKR